MAVILALVVFECDTFVFVWTCLEEKFVSTPKFGGNKYALVNMATDVLEQKLSRSYQSGGRGVDKINLNAFNKVSDTCVNTEISVCERFCNGVTDFTQGGNILSILNLLCCLIIANIVVVIFVCLTIKRRGI
jgi:hypothetical protein